MTWHSKILSIHVDIERFMNTAPPNSTPSVFEKPPILFKYMGAAGFVSTLKDKRLKLSRPDDFNDPFEFLPKFDFSHELIVQGRDGFDPTPLYNANHGKLIPSHISLSEFKSIDPNDPRTTELLRECLQEKYSQNHGLSFQEKHSSLVCALCLAESPANNLMWSHYTGNQQGVCIGLRQNTENDSWNNPGSDGFRLRPVEYSSDRGGVEVTDLLNPVNIEFNREQLEQIYFRKSSDWSYENEWRILYPNGDSRIVEDTSLEMHFIPFDPQSDITEISLGARVRFLPKRELFPLLKTLYEIQNWKAPPKLYQMGLRSTKNRLLKIERPNAKDTLGRVCAEFIHMNTGNSHQDRKAYVEKKGSELAGEIQKSTFEELEKSITQSITNTSLTKGHNGKFFAR